ncbi:MAG: S-layer homology domain-containing protein [Saccharofermentans sp.]|nr:S-layer homology domain-containing protein [Saccharofermentans sp.]
MKMTMKLFLTAAFAVSFAAVPAFTAFAANGVAVNKTNFPDEAFREFILKNIDKNGNKELSSTEISSITSMDLTDLGVKDITGIKYFTALTGFTCKNAGWLYEADFSSNIKLKTINLDGCAIDELNVTKNTLLEKLDCSSNHLHELDVSKNTALKYLNISYNQIRQIDLTKNRALTYLNYGKNCGMEGLNEYWHLEPDLSKNTLLEELRFDNIRYSYLDNSFVPELDLNHLTRLKKLSCRDNGATSLAINNCKALTYLDCSSNDLSSIDLSANVNLKELWIDGNDLTGLDLANNKELLYLYCDYNKLSSLVLTNNTKLKKLECEANKLTSLDVGTLKALELLKCGSNKLNKLILTSNTALKELDCSYNSIKTLDLSNHTKLTRVEAGRNVLTSIKVSGDTALTYLGVRENKIASLDLSGLTALTKVDCDKNAITAFNASGCKALDMIWCCHNKINTMNLTGCKAITQLLAYNNNLTSLAVNDCPMLLKAYWTDRNEQEYDDTDTGIHLHYYIYSWSGEFATADYGKNSFMYLDTKVRIKDPLPSPTPTPRPTATPTPGSSGSYTLYRPGTIICGADYQAKITFSPAAKSVKWKSSDKSTATVDSKGVIKGIKAGPVTITATADDGRYASFTVTILYKDVTNSKDFWYEPTNYLTAKGVVKGYDEQTKFKPGNDCTRAQMVTFIWRLMGEPKPKNSTCKFTDVEKTDYFYKACIWGNENHIVEGYKDGTFGPKIICARRHAVTFLWRLAGSPEPKSTTNNFSDVKTGDYFYKATLWASEKKILAGYDDGTFRPDSNCLRRQMVTFLYKYDKYVNNR